MKNQKSSGQIECPQTKFQRTNIKVNVQVYNVSLISRMWDGVIMKSRKSHYRQVPYHAYSTYIQTSNQAIRDKKPIKKVQAVPKLRKLYKTWKICENFSQKYVQKGYMTSPTPKSHHVLIGSRGATTKNKKQKN